MNNPRTLREYRVTLARNDGSTVVKVVRAYNSSMAEIEAERMYGFTAIASTGGAAVKFLTSAPTMLGN